VKIAAVMHAPTSSASSPPPALRARWRMPPLLKASAACHVGAGALVLAQPALWPWALGALAADHALITATGLWPRSTWLGANLRRLPPTAAARHEVALTIDDGPDPELTPAVLDLLDAHGARATFFCIARRAAAHPALCREIVRRGHSVQNHSLRHAHSFSLLGPGAIRRELVQAQEVLAQITGRRPRFFRAPAGLRNLFLDPVLHELDLQLASWTRRGFDTARGDPAAVLARLTRGLAAGDILLVHDHHAATAPSGRPVVLEVLPLLLQRFAHDGLRAVTLDEAMGEAKADETRGIPDAAAEPVAARSGVVA
jgi:peptidoglycan-N-acetylglucosamine deacetylase